MKNYTLLFLAAAALLLGSILLAGCGLEDDPANDTADLEAQKLDAPAYPAGRFEANPPGSGPFVSITLRGNGTFVAEENVVCAQAQCELPRIEGSYKFTRAGEKRYLHLTTGDGADVRWAWQKFGDELQLRKAGSSGWAVLGHIAIE
jgi:hypothetical protein